MSGFNIDDELIRKLADLMAEKGLSEIELSENDRSLRLSRAGQTVLSSVPVAPPTSVAAAIEVPEAAPGDPIEGAITSPMVGTVYTSPDPSSPPYVSVGSDVREGQTVLIVEAMKVMNPILAPKSGKVTQLMVKNSQPVEFGEILMVVA